MLGEKQDFSYILVDVLAKKENKYSFFFSTAHKTGTSRCFVLSEIFI